MTTTPESWDDVGCLRIQVDCISQKVEDVQKGLAAFHGLNDSQLERLRKDVALIYAKDQDEKKEKGQKKVCSNITPVLLGCVLALLACVFAVQMFMIYTGLNPVLIHRLSDEPGKKHLGDLTSSATTSQVNKEKQRSTRNGITKRRAENELIAEVVHERTEKMMSRRRAQKPNNSWKVAEKSEPKPKQTMALEAPELESKSAQQPKLSPDAEGDARGVAEPFQEKSSDSGEETKDREGVESAEDKDPDQGGEQDNEELVGHQRLSHGLFWVCFPSSTLEQNVKKYAQVFSEVARRQKTVYPFCYVDAKKLNPDELLCDDSTAITFVMEKEGRSDAVSDKNHASTIREVSMRSSFCECMDAFLEFPSWFTFESSAKFRRVYPPDQDLQASLVEQFLDDVYSGKVPEAVPTKRDL